MKIYNAYVSTVYSEVGGVSIALNVDISLAKAAADCLLQEARRILTGYTKAKDVEAARDMLNCYHDLKDAIATAEREAGDNG